MLTNEEIRDAFESGIISVGSDYSCPGETQYVLFLKNHPGEDFFDSYDKEVFIGSIPGGQETYNFMQDYRNKSFSDESLNFIRRMTDKHTVFCNLVLEDLLINEMAMVNFAEEMIRS